MKAQLQVAGALKDTRTARSSALGVARDIMRSPEGVRGLYRGLGAVVAGGLPGAASYFAGAEAARYAFASRNVSPASSPAADAAVGITAQLVGGLVFTPVDVIKERRQAQRLMTTRSVASCNKSLFSSSSSSSSSSSLGGLFKGYWATNAVWIPWSGLYFAGYEAIKRRLLMREGQRGGGGGDGQEQTQQQETPPPPACVVLFSSAAAASGAALVTHPLDVVKTRMQVLSGGGGGGNSSPLPSSFPNPKEITARSVAAAAWRTEGASAFWAGAGPRALQLAAGTALQWLMYEKGKEAIREASRVVEGEEEERRWT